jgi:DNA-binding HxlR family transcriptional regulator
MSLDTTVERTPSVDEAVLCSIERSLTVLGERWSPLILRELHYGNHRFSEIRDRLGIASNLLSKRLQALTAAGVVEQSTYREPGARSRQRYELTPSGRDALVILGAFQQWGDRHAPRIAGPTVLRRHRGTGAALHVAFVTDDGVAVALDDVEMVVSPGAEAGTLIEA